MLWGKKPRLGLYMSLLWCFIPVIAFALEGIIPVSALAWNYVCVHPCLRSCLCPPFAWEASYLCPPLLERHHVCARPCFQSHHICVRPCFTCVIPVFALVWNGSCLCPPFAWEASLSKPIKAYTHIQNRDSIKILHAKLLFSKFGGFSPDRF